MPSTDTVPSTSPPAPEGAHEAQPRFEHEAQPRFEGGEGLGDDALAAALAGAVVLVDLNYTLVGNSPEKRRPFTEQIARETYRPWLVEVLLEARTLRRATLVLITARPDRHRRQTLDRIYAETGLIFELTCFNEHGLMPPASKQMALQDHVVPRFGLPGAPGARRYVAIESNPRTRAMYAQLGIASLRVDDSGTGLVWATSSDR